MITKKQAMAALTTEEEKLLKALEKKIDAKLTKKYREPGNTVEITERELMGRGYDIPPIPDKVVREIIKLYSGEWEVTHDTPHGEGPTFTFR